MKRILFPAAFVLALSGGLAFAQEPAPQPQQAPAPIVRSHEHHAQDPHGAAMRLSKQLNLTPDQTAKIEPIFADRDQKLAALKSGDQTDPKTFHKQMHAIQRDTQQQLAGVLTPEQLEQMKSMHHGGHHGPPPQPATPSPTAL
jgi:periplasmic protein CpxP/Spy